jgi:hypothetical protein
VYAGRVAPDRSTVPLWLSLPYNGALTYRLESITAGEPILVMSDGTQENLDPRPAD